MRRVQIREPMSDSGPHTLDGHRLRRHQDGVVQAWHLTGRSELGHRRWRDHPVIDDRVRAPRQPASSRSSCVDHHTILCLRFRKPGRDVPLVDEREELIARHQGAAGEARRQHRGDSRLPCARWARGHQQLAYSHVLSCLRATGPTRQHQAGARAGAVTPSHAAADVAGWP
jgi:hypothetical protein